MNLKETIRNSLEMHPDSFDKQRSALILNIALSFVGLGALTGIKAAGFVKDANYAVLDIDLDSFIEQLANSAAGSPE